MTDDLLLEAMQEAAAAVAQALSAQVDWGEAGTRPGQYHSDLAADQVAIDVLDKAGLGVLSEESGHHGRDRAVTVVLDPLDGSTNASLRLPWYATSLCAVDGDGLRAAVVVDLVSKRVFEARRGGGARVDGRALRPSGCSELSKAVVGLSGWPARHLGWRQYRALGAAALDLCAVADGRLDAYIDCSTDAHGPWDYLGGLLICHEAGAAVADALGRELVVLDHSARRTPVAAATPALLTEALIARSG